MSEEFAAAPKVVKPKPKYKEEPEEQQEDEIKLIYNNLMWDKRIVRGNTHAPIVTLRQPQVPRGTIRAPVRANLQQTTDIDPARRANIEIFTDQLVESLTDKPPRYEWGGQTEPVPEKAVTRLRMEQKRGRDKDTQIWDGELFEFDYEVQPLLNVLCGRTLEMSRLQVLQEEQLRIMSNRQQELRLYEKEEARKIREMYTRQEQLQQANLAQIQAHRIIHQKNLKTHRRLFSRVLAKQYLRDLRPNTLNFVEGHGFFRHPNEGKLLTQVVPVLYSQALVISQQQQALLQQAWSLLQATKISLTKEHAWAREVENTRRKKILEARAEKAREKKERAEMGRQEKWMVIWLAEEKARLQREEEERAAQQQVKEEGGEESA